MQTPHRNSSPIAATSPPGEATDLTRISERYLRLAFAALLALLAWHAFRDELGTVPLLSDIDLAVHEFGHMLFMPFGIPILGRTMVILGGSLTQVAFPLIFVAYFLKRNTDGRRRDVFAAMVCVWWSAINLLDVAIYCADSRAGQLMLLNGSTGQESDGHDWYNLLSGWGLLEHDIQIARVMRAVAALVCLGAILASVATQLRAQRRDRERGLTASTIAD